MAKFPGPEWVQALVDKLNSDEKYARTARNWEGDFRFIIEPSGSLAETLYMYVDLWHGKCREAYLEKDDSGKKPAFVLRASYDNMKRILTGNLDPMQAMMTRKLNVHGSMVAMMRNVPTVLDFVRCCREVTDSFV